MVHELIKNAKIKRFETKTVFSLGKQYILSLSLEGFVLWLKVAKGMFNILTETGLQTHSLIQAVVWMKPRCLSSYCFHSKQTFFFPSQYSTLCMKLLAICFIKIFLTLTSPSLRVVNPVLSINWMICKNLRWQAFISNWFSAIDYFHPYGIPSFVLERWRIWAGLWY